MIPRQVDTLLLLLQEVLPYSTGLLTHQLLSMVLPNTLLLLRMKVVNLLPLLILSIILI
jgi:hypothetical protein